MLERKRGQMYLIAAIVIIGLIAGLFTIANYSSKRESTHIKELAKELREESESIIDYEIASGDNKMDEFTSNFSLYASGVEIYYLTGEIGLFEVYTYNNSLKQSFPFSQNGNTVILNVHGNNYNFNMREGKNFYFVMYQELQGEVYVETS